MCHVKEERDASQPLGIVAGRACFLVVVFFTFMVLFNGVAMFESATKLEYGPTRDFWVAVLRPVERLSRMSGLFYVRHVTQEKIGNWLNKTSKE